MHDNLPLILTLTGGLAAALICGYITQRLKLSPLVGYLLAGIAVGPYTPGFIADIHLAEQLAEVGVILLMFGVGLNFHVKELLAVRRIAVPGAIFQIIVATSLGILLGQMLGWNLGAGIVYGLAIAVASTVVLIRVLSDNNELHSRIGHIAVGWLVIEDLFTVIVLVILPTIVAQGENSAWVNISWAMLKIAVLVAITFIAGGKLIPWLLGRVSETRSRELFTLTVLVIALGIAVGSAQIFGVSMALGAFMAGMVVGRSDFSLRAAIDALPMRDAFAVLFFVAAGMLLDWHALLASPLAVVGSLAIVLIGKPIAALAIVLFLKYPMKTALSVAVVLAQIGEFSFILGAMAGHLGILPDGANDILVATAIISISLNPLYYRMIGPLHSLLERSKEIETNGMMVRNYGHSNEKEPQSINTIDAVIIGYGPVGRTMAGLIQESGQTPLIVELNHETAMFLRDKGMNVIYADASHGDTLSSAGIERASLLILSASDVSYAEEIIRQAHHINPNIKILARANFQSEKQTLLDAGASVVISSEEEIARSMSEYIRKFLGETKEQKIYATNEVDGTEPR